MLLKKTLTHVNPEPLGLHHPVLVSFGIQPAEAQVPPLCVFIEKGVLGTIPYPLLFVRLLSSVLPPVSSLTVSISDVETIRKGHDSELLRCLVEEFPLEQGFTIVFHGRRPNLDLVANSVEEAQIWMRGLQLLVDLVASMDYQEQMDQYQPDGVRVWTGVSEGARCFRTREDEKECSNRKAKGCRWCEERKRPV